VARKKRKDEEKEEEYVWVPPEFDEKAFLTKDIGGTKALMFAALMAFLFGLLASVIGNAAGAIVGFVVYIAGVFIMFYSFRFLKIRTEDIDKKTLIGNIALYMLLGLGIWILFINPPFV
jgi:4-hydroxybenzoate polyprenyltransferase